MTETQPSSKDLLAHALERVAVYRKDETTLLPYARSMIALADEIERLQRANRTRPEYNLRCEDCGRAHIVDTSIPSEIWTQIAGDASILCTTCIDDRMVKHGLEGEAKFYFVGKALTCALYEGDRDEIKDACRAEFEPEVHCCGCDLELGLNRDGTHHVAWSGEDISPCARASQTKSEGQS